MKKIMRSILLTGGMLALAACGSGRPQPSTGSEMQAAGPAFDADSAYSFCAAQCQFGPRTMNSEAHEQCRAWIVAKFSGYGLAVTEQQADLKGYDGTTLHSTNIIASYRPEATERILICAHWDSRPWADNDPDEQNWHEPVMAANDGASGVGVMLEVARLLSADPADSSAATKLADGLGVDFICFDAEDWGLPQWAEEPAGNSGDTWALGAQYWAAHPHKAGYRARYGVLLDMVGGMGARFFCEGYSRRYAQHVVNRVWQSAHAAGYGSYFPRQNGGTITDDHVPLNEVAGIPTIDIIPFYPDCEDSSFGPTWHTVSDDMQHLDRNTLRAVGQTVVQLLYAEQL